MAASRREQRREADDIAVVEADATACPSVAMLLIQWQETGSDAVLASLVGIVLPEVRRVIEAMLRRRGIRDPAAADDAVALVLDHLRRLPAAAGGREVTSFSPARASPRSRQERDPGIGYLRQLARARASDIARARRRRRSVPFSALGADAGASFERSLEVPAGCDASLAGERLAEAARRLEPRLRAVVELLLEGKSQALIAHVLGVSEGTISRLRARAIAALRQILES